MRLEPTYAMRHGTVPIVHSVGGLRDTVQLRMIHSITLVPAGVSIPPNLICYEKPWATLGDFRDHRESFRGLQTRGMEKDYVGPPTKKGSSVPQRTKGVGHRRQIHSYTIGTTGNNNNNNNNTFDDYY